MFADAQKESQAKLRVYRESVNWVLEKQRQDQNIRLSGLDDPDDLREVLQEAALCVVQSGNETTQLSMLKARFQDSANPVARVLKTAQDSTGQSEDKTLNNLLTTFYLRPGEGDQRGSVEFAHKSFGEYLFAERLISAFEEWIQPDRRKKRFQMDDRAIHGQIYDLLGFGGLSVEVVENVFELLNESEIDRVRLFQRLHIFYERWYEGEFLDQAPTENLPQKKFLQLKEQNISIGLRQVDAFTGLNILIILFRLHAAVQPKNYPNILEDKLQPEIWFHPCGEPDTEQFDSEKLLKIIYYADALNTATFTKIVGPHLTRANLTRANLTRANLTGANLTRANLTRANLTRANLTRANLTRANLTKAYLASAKLYSAHLGSANLTSANLNNAKLTSASLISANLYSANLTSAYLYSAKLYSANLTSTNLDSADLNSTYLTNTNLDSASLNSANLTGANLTGAKLTNTYLTNADLTSAHFTNADLTSAHFTNANLTSANLTNANLTNANLTSANLTNANLTSANLTSTNLDRVTLLGTQLSTTQNLASQQLEGEIPPLIFNATLPPGLEAYHDRDRNRLPAVLHERYPEQFKSIEAAEKYINEHHPPQK